MLYLCRRCWCHKELAHFWSNVLVMPVVHVHVHCTIHYCVQNIWATYGPHMGSPYATHMQPICGPYVEYFQKQPNCMWPICCLTYGNIWRKTNQHMGRTSTYGKHIWADGVILALKVGTSEHMSSIWETYGEHTLNGQYPEQHKQTSPFPCCCSTLKLSQASTKFVLKYFY